MSWAPGTIVVCVDDRWNIPGPAPIVGEYCTVTRWYDGDEFDDGVPAVDLCGYPSGPSDDAFDVRSFRLAEGGACESERARAMQPITTHEKANK